MVPDHGKSFEEAAGIDVAMTRKSSGETFAQIQAEANNPKGDVWWGGTGNPHLQDAEEDLTDPVLFLTTVFVVSHWKPVAQKPLNPGQFFI